MRVTEVLLLGYEHGRPVCAVNLESDFAQVTLTHADDFGETVVDAAWQRDTTALADVCEIVQELATTPVR